MTKLGNLRLTLSLLTGAAALSLTQAAYAQHGGDGEIPHQFVLRLVPGQAIEPVAADHGATIIGADPAHRLYLLHTPDSIPDRDTERALQADARVENSEVNHIHEVPEAVTQSFFVRVLRPDYTNQPAIAAVGLDAAHALASGNGVVVAVLDTGVFAHTDIAPNLMSGGYNFVDGNTNTDDVLSGLDTNANGVVDEAAGHGTMVAGLIALAAPGCRILPVRVLDSDGVGNSFTVAEGLHFAAEHGARIINLSLSSPTVSPIIADALSSVAGTGITVVVAVGNSGSPSPAYPAAGIGALAVAATSNQGVHSAFSDYGSYVALSAPGEGAVGLLPDGTYGRASGVSFAAPWVSGTAALLLSARPNASPAAVRQFLAGSALNIDAQNPGYVGLLGSGLLAAGAAVSAAAPSADLNGDGVVTVGDFLLYLQYFGTGDARADLTEDGAVTLADFLYYLQLYATGH